MGQYLASKLEMREKTGSEGLVRPLLSKLQWFVGPPQN